MTWGFGILLVLVVLSVLESPLRRPSAGAGTAPPSSKTAAETLPEWPIDWTDKSPFIVNKVLVRNEISGCGEFWTKASRRNTTRFLVRCYNGEVWRDHLIDGWKVDGSQRVEADGPAEGDYFPRSRSPLESEEASE